MIDAPAITHFTGGATYQFAVQYSDDQAVLRASLDNADVKVVSPGGTALNATLVPGSTSSSDGPVLTATYEIAVPGGAWDHGDNGTYQIRLQTGQVLDTSFHAARPRDLAQTELIGTFDCNYGVFFVDSAVDSVDANPGDGIAADSQGRTTLRAAVIEANALAGDNTIVLGPGQYYLYQGGAGEDAAAAGDLDVFAAESLTIKGDPGGTKIWSSTGDRIFQVFGQSTLNLDNVNLRGGSATGAGDDGDGAGIYNSGTLTTQDVSIENGVAARNGGGIFNDGTLIIQNSSVSANRAGGDGGGIFSNGSLLEITQGGQIGRNFAAGYGGGIAAFGSTAVIGGSSIHDNTADVGGGVYSESSQLTIQDGSSVVENTANSGGGGVGVYDGTAIIQDTTISRNSVVDSGGGGIESWTDMILTRVTLAENQAITGGGIRVIGFEGIVPVVILDQCVLLDNRAESHGGGIHNLGGVVTISDSTVSGNSAISFGGGVFNTSSLTVHRSTFSHNTAGQTGGAIQNLWRLIMTETSVADNIAGDKGGGIYSRMVLVGHLCQHSLRQLGRVRWRSLQRSW